MVDQNEVEAIRLLSEMVRDLKELEDKTRIFRQERERLLRMLKQEQYIRACGKCSALEEEEGE